MARTLLNNGQLPTAISRTSVQASSYLSGATLSIGGGDFAVSVTGKLSNALVPSADDTYDLGSNSLQWKDLYLDGTAYLDTVDIDAGAIDGVTIGSNSPATILRVSGSSVNIQGSSGNTGAMENVAIGATVAAAGTFTTVVGTTGTYSGVLKTDDTTEATSTTDGSLQTDGGLSVAKSAVIGDDLDLLSDGAIFAMGAGQDVKITHDGGTGATLASAGAFIIDGAAAVTVDSDAGLTIGGASIDMDADGGAVAIDGTGGINIGTATSGVAISIGHGTSEVTVNDNLTITGDLIVNGSTTTIDATNTEVKDRLIGLGYASGSGVASGGDTGLVFNVSGSSSAVALYYDTGTSRVKVVTTSSDASSSNITDSSFQTFQAGTLSGSVLSIGGGDFYVANNGTVQCDLLPTSDGNFDLGSATYEWQDLYIDGTAYLDTVDIDAGAIDGVTIGSNSVATILRVSGSSVNIQASSGNTGAIENMTIGATVAAAGTFTTLVAGGNVDLGDATSDTITATGRFDSDLVPSTDGARDLGASSLEWKDLYIDGVAYIDSLQADQLGAAMDCNNQAMTNVNIDSGAIELAALNIDGGTDIGADLAATDLIIVDDGAGGTNRKSALSRVGTFLTGDGLQVSSGVMSIDYVTDVLYSGSGGNLSSDLVTASVSAAPLADSLQVYLNGMLQTKQGGSGLIASNYDYTVSGSGASTKVVMSSAIDSDDVLTVTYIKN